MKQNLKMMLLLSVILSTSMASWGFILHPTYSAFIRHPGLTSRPVTSDPEHYLHKNVRYALESATDKITSSIEESALEFEEMYVRASQSNSGVDHAQNGHELIKMDSISCACEEEDNQQQYNRLVKELFVTLIQKVRCYNPEAVEGIIDLLAIQDDDDSTSIEDIMAAHDAMEEEPQGAVLLRAYQFAKAAHRGQCRKSGEPYISEFEPKY